jgi:hypothetical protein
MNENNDVAINFDQSVLLSQRVNPNFDEPIIAQVLRISLYDEYHAFETYKKTIETFGEVQPFVNIIQAEQNHINVLLAMCSQYGVEAPINDWSEKIDLPNSVLECCEVGVVAELDNIKMYDGLLKYVDQYPDVQDIFYQLQAASYNNHLPAFRDCVQRYSQEMQGQSMANEMPTMNMGMNDAKSTQTIDDFRNMANKFSNGQMNQQDVMRLLGSLDMATMGGLILGGIGAMQLVKSLENNKEGE